MLPLVIPYPEIDPVLVQLGPFAIRWYALAYIAGLVIGWQIMRRVCEQPPTVLTPTRIDDFLLWAALGVILGGRLGYVLFYKPAFFLQHPLAILTLWEGGMSFHGGLLGVVVAILLFSWRNGISPLVLGDRRRLFDVSAFEPMYFHDFDVSADGQRFLFIRAAPESRPTRLDVIVNWQPELARLVK